MLLRSPNTSSSTLWTWPAYLLFFIMLAFPTLARFLYPRQFLVALLLMLIGIQGLTTGLRIDRKVTLWTLFLAAVSLTFGLRGLVLGAPGALVQIQLYAVWPLIYLLLLSGVDGRILQGLERTLIFSTCFIAVYVLVYVMSEFGIIPKIPLFEQLLTPEEANFPLLQSVSIMDGHVEIYVIGIGSLAFLVPFLMAAAVSRGARYAGRWVSRKWLLGALFLNLPVVILSGRRALQLVTMLAPLLTLAFGVFLPREDRRSLMKSLRRATLAVAVFIILLVALLSILNAITFQGLADRFTSGFDFSASNRSDNSVGRVDQYLGLMRGWREAPFIGKGLGAAAHDSIRSEDRPWNYELTYVDLLFQVGLLGFAAYAAGILWVYWTGIKVIARGGAAAQFMLPTLVGMSAMLIANATNPYLRSFDSLWPVFLPLAFLNHWLLLHPSSRIVSPAQTQELGGLTAGSAC